jgi:O-antigen ligase
LAYRFHPTEMGGANLVARSVMLIAPLGLALASTWQASPRRLGHTGEDARSTRKMTYIAGGLFLLGSAFVVIYSQSWGNFFAWLLSLGIYAALVYWEQIRSSRFWPRTRLAKGGIFVGLLLVGAMLGYGLINIASRVNVYSFNGRLIHWYGAILTVKDHPWLGGGPGFESIYAPYANAIRLFFDAQTTTDAPLTIINIDAGRTLRTHSHNLFSKSLLAAGYLVC